MKSQTLKQLNFHNLVLTHSTTKLNNEDVSWNNEIKYYAKSLTEKSPITRGSINDAIETMKLIEKIYKADPIWQEKYYKLKINRQKYDSI